MVSSDPGNARLLGGAYEHIKYLNELEETLIIPGFLESQKRVRFALFPVVVLILLAQLLRLVCELNSMKTLLM